MATKKKTKKTPEKKKVTRSYTTTSGTKVTKYSDGSESRSGGSSSSSSSSKSTSTQTSKELQLESLNNQLKDLQKQLEIKKAEESNSNRDLPIGPQSNSLKSLSIALSKGINVKQSDIDKGNIDKMINDFIESSMDSVIGSGKIINPGITDDDIDAIDMKNFLDEAEATIKDEYKSKFLVAKNSLIEGLKTIDYDYAQKILGIEKDAKDTLIAGSDELASRGLAFSSNRTKFNKDLTEAEQRANEAEKETARRSALNFGTAAEDLLGTEYVKSLNLPSVAGRSSNSFTKGGSVIGTLNSDKQFLKESIARQLSTDEANRRSYATRSLNFQ